AERTLGRENYYNDNGEFRAEALRRMFAFVASDEASRPKAAWVQHLRGVAAQIEPAYDSAPRRALRLRLLRQLPPSTCDDDALLLTEGLRSAAVEIAEILHRTTDTLRGEGLVLISSALRYLPFAERLQLLRSPPVAALTADELAPLLDLGDASRAATEVQVRCLLHRARHRGAAPEAWIRQALERVLRRPSASSAALMAALAEGADLLALDHRVEALERVARVTDAAALIAWLDGASADWDRSGINLDVPRCTFDAARALVGRQPSLDALAGVLDLLCPAEELDSFENWDPAPKWPLREALKRLLGHERITRPALRDLADELVDGIPSLTSPWRPQSAPGPLQAAVWARLATLAESTSTMAAFDAAPDERTTELLAKHYDGCLDVDDLTEGLLAYTTTPIEDLQRVLVTLVRLSRWVGGKVITTAFARFSSVGALRTLDEQGLTDLLLAMAAHLPPPPTGDAGQVLTSIAAASAARLGGGIQRVADAVRSAPMRDFARQRVFEGLLSGFLEASSARASSEGAEVASSGETNSAPPWVKALLTDLDRFPALDPSLLDVALAALVKAPDGGYEALRLLTPRVGKAQLKRWIEAVASVGIEGAIADVLAGPSSGRTLDDVLDALDAVESPAVIRHWISNVAWHGSEQQERLVRLSRKLDGEQRIDALLSLASKAGEPFASELVRAALGQAKSTRVPSASTLDSLTYVALKRPQDEQLVADVIALAVALPERASRHSALARLAPVLRSDALLNVGVALRQLDDGPARVKALQALAEAIGEVAPRRQALDDALRTVDSQLSGSGRALARLLLIDYLPDSERADALAEAAGCVVHPGFTAAELLRAAGRQVPFVPYRVARSVVRWLARLAPGAERTAVAVGLLPCLPDGARAAALALLDPRADAAAISAAAPWADEASVHALRRKAGL
ncbi:MAG: hypothetical protein ABIX12_07075, partial [Rubrivivax sp.]